MKYRLENIEIEAIEPYVRVTIHNWQGSGKPRHAVTKRMRPTSIDVATMLSEMIGYWPTPSLLNNCARAAADARDGETIRIKAI
jgi:hypothetical protein